MAKSENDPNQSTEEKIKAAAQQIFIRKGFSGATTREIADEAGIKRALLNYYFRSKERLFDAVAHDQVAILFGGIFLIVNNQITSLEAKIDELIAYYTDVLLSQPSMVLFVLNEMQNNPGKLSELMKNNLGLNDSVIARQLKEARPDIHPMHFLMSILGMILFPYIGGAFFQQSMDMQKDTFNAMLKERAKLLPGLISGMLGP